MHCDDFDGIRQSTRYIVRTCDRKKKDMSVDKKSRNATQRLVFPAQVSGQFYVADEKQLRSQVDTFLAKAKKSESIFMSLKKRDLVAILSPHAGYVYSGEVAGVAYAVAAKRKYKTVIVMALNHRRAAGKISLLDMDAYRTPLGELEIDRERVQTLVKNYPQQFAGAKEMFEQEHSLEVQLPFIQTALPDAKIVPMIVACMDESILQGAAKILYREFGAHKDVLFVISSDLSHFYPYKEAQVYDNTNLNLLESWEIDQWVAHASNSRKGMCGVNPIFTFAQLFEEYDVSTRGVTRLKYLNSGDTTGDKKQVVGYGALAFTLQEGVRAERTSIKDFGPYDLLLRREIMTLAKKSVRAAVMGENPKETTPTSILLKNDGAAFVTLKRNGQLRGCIGHVIARVPLYQCVKEVAMAAATRDSRFSPVSGAELDEISYEISILTSPQTISADDVVVGRDGLIISRGPYSGLLLPQVPVEWEWDREQFLAQTCRKAGLPIDCWKDDETSIQAFRAIVFGEDDL